MINQHKVELSGSNCKAFGLLFLLIFIIYSNTFNASWHLDDYHNIVNNPHLKIANLEPKTIIQTFYANFEKGLYPGNKIFRPIPCMTFALNWHWGKDNLFGYHLVNISIHFLTAFLLFLSIIKLFQSPNLKEKYQGNQHFIALLSAVLWAANPIQTQAVTYIVQRMASMAAMFYIMGLFCYLMGRLTPSKRNRWLYFICCAFSFVLAFGSKENAITFPITLVLLETIFFRDFSEPKTKKIFFIVTIVLGIAIVLFGSALFLQGNPFSFLKGYENRFYSPLERLITQPRVLILYLTQIFYPVPTRLSIEHDITASTSLIDPWTTLPAAIIILGLICFGFSQIRKRPLIGFAILFFFLNHAIESTILNLELIFEHRNYLPSMFLFLPVAAGLKWLIDHYCKKNSWLGRLLICFVSFLIIGFGIGTYIRNMAWITEESLWKDAVSKAPQSSRACHNLAWGYYELSGQTDKALSLYSKCLDLIPPGKLNKSQTWNNLAAIHYARKNYTKAAQLWETAYNLHPQVEYLQFRMARALLYSQAFDRALLHLDELLHKRPLHVEYNMLKGSVLLEQHKHEEALPYFRKALRQRPYLPEIIKNFGTVFHLMGDYKRAEFFFKNAYSLDQQEPITLLWLAAVNVRQGDTAAAEIYLNELYAMMTVNKLQVLLETISNPDNMLPSQRELLVLRPLISRTLLEWTETGVSAGKYSIDKSD
jgi:tetratricopeptide (TPR) repeat protein